MIVFKKEAMTLKGVLSLLALVLTTFVYAQQDPAAREVLDAMSNKYRKVPAFTADFTYILENPQEGLNEQFAGKITVKGAKFKLELEGQEIINDGETVWTYLGEVNEVTINTYSPDDAEINLNNIFDLYKTGYKYMMVDDMTTATKKTVDLVPDDKNLNYFKIRMDITSAGNNLNSFKIFDKSGNRYTYAITKFTEQPTLSDKVFVFDIAAHKGIEVIDFR